MIEFSWGKLMGIFKNINRDWRDRRLITQFYFGQTVTGGAADGEPEPGMVGRGVTQGCSLPPVLE